MYLQKDSLRLVERCSKNPSLQMKKGNWIDGLNALKKIHNNTVHFTIKLTPTQASVERSRKIFTIHFRGKKKSKTKIQKRWNR